jgi:hypothetical protein
MLTLPVPVQPVLEVAVTEYVPGLETVMHLVVAPVFQT